MTPSMIQPSTIRFARKLRREMTDGERRLWSELREFRHHFDIHVRRQVPIGPYIADFAVHSKKLVIEIDGEFHQVPERMSRDEKRDRWLRSQGYHVIRISTGDLEQAFDGCVEEIMRALGLMDEENLAKTD
ncbi:endonuclease domain-containing protein [Gellertiella hungarica]|uniref:endonuclease domain-containing protein n=2 Tax=Gellertiella hungarica TaxID=1572859 RepID=UPI001608B8C8|nr:endonuclease domain-containing protein [Gellertiella hungarica]